MKNKTVILSKERGVTLTAYPAKKAKRISFLICPGGGYNNCERAEADPIAKAYNKRGYTAFILRYSVGKHRAWPNPINDFDAAMEYLINNADEFGIDSERITAVGFSAGGHVVTAAASAAKHRPFAAIACYGLSANETLAFCNEGAPDTAELVNNLTCPVFLASSRNDWIVPIFNTTRLINAFEKHFVDYEAHIYGYSLHGFGLGAETKAVGPLFCSRVGEWFDDSLSWLNELSEGRYRSIKESCAWQDAHSEKLSTMNSCRLLFSTPAAAKVIRKSFPMQYALYVMACKKIGAFMDTVSLRNLLELMKVKERVIAGMDDALSAFENREVNI